MRKVFLMGLVGVVVALAAGQQQKPVWNADEKPLAEQIHGLRALPDDVRAKTTRDLAVKIRQLPLTDNKLRLAVGLANLSTEGDFGHDTLQEVATTLAAVLKEHPLAWAKAREEDAGGATPKTAATAKAGAKSTPTPTSTATAAGGGARPTQAEHRTPAEPYVELASLVRYEHVSVSIDDEQYRVAMARLEADDEKRQHAEFALKDLAGKTWTLSSLRGKVVLVNFWATWCPPCRKEMPDLEALYEKFGEKGLVILGISDEEAGKVEPFIKERKVTFPVLLDPGRKVNDMFIVEGIPKSFVYDRDGKLVAQSIDMRTRGQFLEMLGKAGME